MLLRQPAQTAVDEKEPFKHDKLGRSTLSNSLTELCGNASTPFIIALDGAWGTGKSTFLSMWERQLSNAGFVTLNFNAWKNDHAPDPIVAFVGEIQEAILRARIDLSSNPAARKTFENVKRLGSLLVKTVGPAALRAATAGVIGGEALREFVSATKLDADSVAGFVEGLAEKQIDEYLSSKKTIESLRTALKQFAEEIMSSKREHTESTQQRPVVFLIDELDRCRPLFAIEFLERLKHIFSVPGFVYVIAVDRSALMASIKAVYGSEFNADDYLRRFMDFRVRLTPPDRVEFLRWQLETLKFLMLFQGRNIQEDPDLMLRYLGAFANGYSMSLRTLEQLMGELYTVLGMTPKKYRLMAREIAIFVALRHAEPDLFEQFLDGTATAVSVIDKLKEKGLLQILSADRDSAFLECIIFKWSLRPNEFEREFGNVQTLANQPKPSIAPKDLEWERAVAMRDVFNWLNNQLEHRIDDYVRNRLRLVQVY